MSTPTAQHTPGPWGLTRSYQPEQNKAAWNTQSPYITNRAGRHVACVLLGEAIPDQEILANARLIAAAPDLLEACYALLESEDSTLGDGGSVIGDAFRIMLREAIARATVAP